MLTEVASLWLDLEKISDEINLNSRVDPTLIERSSGPTTLNSAVRRQQCCIPDVQKKAGAVIGEWTASSNQGLGTFLLSANASMDTAGVYAAMLLMTAIGVGSFLTVLGLEVVATPWRTRSIAPSGFGNA